jgi:hypothetical protein
MCIIVCHVIFPMWMANLTHPWPLCLLNYDVCCVGSPHELPVCWFVAGVQEAGLWLVCGMFDIAFGLGTSWQMVLPLVHLIDVVPIVT